MTVSALPVLSSLIQLGARMRRLALFVELLDRGVDGAGEVGGVLERVVGQVVALEVAPAPFDCVSMMPLYVGFLVRAGCDAALA